MRPSVALSVQVDDKNKTLLIDAPSTGTTAFSVVEMPSHRLFMGREWTVI